MKTINQLIALIITLCSLNGYSQILPTLGDSTGIILPPVESLEVIRQSVLNGGVQINNGLDLSGNALFRNDANIAGSLQVLDLQVNRNIQFTGLVDNETPVDQWLTIDETGEVVPLSSNQLLEAIYELGFAPCISAEGVVNPTGWTNPPGTADLVTFECQENTKVGINTQTPQATLDVAGSTKVSGNLTVGNTITGLTTLNSNQLDHFQNTLEINANTGQAVQFGKNANYNAVNVTITGNNTVLGDLIVDNELQTKNLTVVENTTTKTLAVAETITANKLGIGAGADDPKIDFQIRQDAGIQSDAAHIALLRNVYYNHSTSQNEYLGGSGMGSKFVMKDDYSELSFYNDSNKSIGTPTSNKNTLMLMKFDKLGINYPNWSTLPASFNIKRKDSDHDYLLIEDTNGDDVFKIASDGTTYAQEIKITLSGDFPDYVFAKDYQLPSLKEVETHIQEKGHLPNIPSAAEVAKEGIGVGELQLKLLEKVEELTLYLLEQQKEIEALKKELKTRD